MIHYGITSCIVGTYGTVGTLHSPVDACTLRKDEVRRIEYTLSNTNPSPSY